MSLDRDGSICSPTPYMTRKEATIGQMPNELLNDGSTPGCFVRFGTMLSVQWFAGQRQPHP